MEKFSRPLNKVIITGATGAIGNAVIRKLLDLNTDVYAIVRPNSQRLQNLPRKHSLHIVPCSLDSINSLNGSLSGADAFFHFGWEKPFGIERNNTLCQIKNVQHSIEAVQLAANASCKVFIFSGSQAEYGRVDGKLSPTTPCFPENGYGAAKFCAGKMNQIECEKYGIDYIHLRILSVYGPYDAPYTIISSTVRNLLDGKRPALSKGEQIWDFLYSEDAAEALIAAAKNGKNGAVYPLGSGSARPLREYIEILRDKIDPSLPLGFGEIPYDPQQVMHLEADISALETDCSFRPRTSFEEGVQKTINWIKGEL